MPIMLVNIFCFYFLELLIQFLNKIGGIGSSIFGRIINSGVSNGLIKGNSAAAGLVMNVDNTPISQSYVKESVTINAPQASGFIFVFRSSRARTSVSDVYTRAKIIQEGNSGFSVGLLNTLDILLNGLFTIINSYSSNYYSNPNSSSSIGSILINTTCSFSNVYFFKQFEDMPSIKSGNCNDQSFPIGLSCPELYSHILGNFDQKYLWSGDNLKNGLDMGTVIVQMDVLQTNPNKKWI
eukprot:TRINITY_DN4918_c0_g1_i3.p1 TRINITY_DN4918_c0_g1~~TRINITY_DN4918_c0_g1_i3.p1  ORF type:complete len:238 (-),score=25.89 TRINITY_DN4918_c0_g1_i3:33-746(-)